MAMPGDVRARRILENLRARLEEIRDGGDDLLQEDLVAVVDSQIESARQLAPRGVSTASLPPLISPTSITDGEPIVIMSLVLRLDAVIQGLPNSWVERPSGRVPTRL